MNRENRKQTGSRDRVSSVLELLARSLRLQLCVICYVLCVHHCSGRQLCDEPSRALCQSLRLPHTASQLGRSQCSALRVCGTSGLRDFETWASRDEATSCKRADCYLRHLFDLAALKSASEPAFWPDQLWPTFRSFETFQTDSNRSKGSKGSKFEARNSKLEARNSKFEIRGLKALASAVKKAIAPNANPSQTRDFRDTQAFEFRQLRSKKPLARLSVCVCVHLLQSLDSIRFDFRIVFDLCSLWARLAIS